jgi:spore germination cell wall hydrolase CwlJ-like protein
MKKLLVLTTLVLSLTVHADDTQQYLEKAKQLEQLIEQNHRTFEKQQQCLAKALYFEAGDNDTSRTGVANVIVNRVVADYYPNTICGVVHEKTQNARTKKKSCQFSFLCEAPKTIYKSSNKWENADDTARVVLAEFVDQSRNDITKGATHFHDKRVFPSWAKSNKFIRTMKATQLTFYRPKK